MPTSDPAAGGLTALLFENPWPIVIVLLSFAAILRPMGKRQGRPRLVTASWIALALGLGVYGLAALIVTDREAITERSHQLVRATSPADEAAFTELFTPTAVLLGPEGNFWDDLDPAFVAGEIRQHGVQDNTARSVDAWTRSATQGISLLDVSSRVNGYPVRTTWEVVWTRPDDGGPWRIASMRWLTWNQQTPSQRLYR